MESNDKIIELLESINNKLDLLMGAISGVESECSSVNSNTTWIDIKLDSIKTAIDNLKE